MQLKSFHLPVSAYCSRNLNKQSYFQDCSVFTDRLQHVYVLVIRVGEAIISEFSSCRKVSASAQLPAGMKNLCIFETNSNRSCKAIDNIMLIPKGFVVCISKDLT